jgi:hypothetical protein
MSEGDRPPPGPEPPNEPEAVDPESSPFATPPIAGLPFKRGSVEDLAIKRVIREAEERLSGSQSGAEWPKDQHAVDPDSSPFATPPIAGLPFKRGSVEDLAIKRVIRESEQSRRTP